MSQLTKQQWEDIDKKLNSFYCLVHLDCDGYKVTLKLERIGQFKNTISVYVNGFIKGKWFVSKPASDEAKRFFPFRSKAIYPEKEKKELIRIFGKRDACERFDLDKRIESYGMDWKSFKQLKKHFIANNESIKLLEK